MSLHEIKRLQKALKMSDLMSRAVMDCVDLPTQHKIVNRHLELVIEYEKSLKQETSGDCPSVR